MSKIILSSLALLILSGCSTAQLLKSTEPQQAIYALHPEQTAPLSQTGMARIVEVTKPALPPGFETDRIALYTDGGRKLDYFSGAKWPDILDNVLQEYTSRSMTLALPYVVAIRPSQTMDANYRLETRINEFQPVYTGPPTDAPQLQVSVEFTLIALPANAIVSSFTLSRQGVADSNRLDVIAETLETMLGEIDREAFTRFDAIFHPKGKDDTHPHQ